MKSVANTKWLPAERLSSFLAIGVPIDGNESYRGCKALSNLKEGELIMPSKAFAIGAKGIAMEWSTHEMSLGDNSRMEMMSEIVRKVWKTPSLGKELYSLSDAGDD